MEREFQHLSSLIDIAVSRIASEYFHLPVAGADTVYRERLYCYELYHQLRCLWGDFPFSLGGEVDKSGNPNFVAGPYAGAEPDLIIHVPGSMNKNLAVVEVKSANARVGGIHGDLRKLTWFCHNAGYHKGIFLLFGDAGDSEPLAERFGRTAGPDIDFMRLNCIYHRYIGQRTESIVIS
jgi:hypothetical protein